jgi:hypothetical protein
VLRDEQYGSAASSWSSASSHLELSQCGAAVVVVLSCKSRSGYAIQPVETPKKKYVPQQKCPQLEGILQILWMTYRYRGSKTNGKLNTSAAISILRFSSDVVGLVLCICC